MHRAIDHVVRHLDGPLRLEEVARAAQLSPYHFHRVFRAVVGETLGQFVKRLRLERALQLLSHDPRASLTDVALACGFSSSSDFSRCFKQRYGVPPSRFDLAEWRASKREDMLATLRDPALPLPLPDAPAPDAVEDFEVVLRDLPPRSVCYLRVLDPYRSDVPGAVLRLLAWAEERGLADGQWLGYQWEDPEVVALEDCRYDVAVEVDPAHPHARAEGEVGRFDFPAMRVAQVEVRGDLALELRVLQWLYGTWLPRSGFVPDDQPGFEAWIGRPFAHGMEHFELHVQLPVVPAR